MLNARLGSGGGEPSQLFHLRYAWVVRWLVGCLAWLGCFFFFIFFKCDWFEVMVIETLRITHNLYVLDCNGLSPFFGWPVSLTNVRNARK